MLMKEIKKMKMERCIMLKKKIKMKMERYIMFMNWKTQHSKDVDLSQMI